jgi:hypothetical protein
MLRKNFASRTPLLLSPAVGDPYSPKVNQRASIARTVAARHEFFQAEKAYHEKVRFSLWNPVFEMSAEQFSKEGVLSWRDYRGKQYWQLVALAGWLLTVTLGRQLYYLYFSESAQNLTQSWRDD